MIERLPATVRQLNSVGENLLFEAEFKRCSNWLRLEVALSLFLVQDLIISEVTQLLTTGGDGDKLCLAQLYELVYEELKEIAVAKMARERPDHTLQPTALVNEAYLRLGGSGTFTFKSRGYFFSAAAEAMRRILVDNARRKRQIKRGGTLQRVELCEAQIVGPIENDKLLQVNEALDALALEDPLKAEVAKLRYFVGLKHQEIASALGISEPTVRRHWAIARIRLFELITQDLKGDGPIPR